MQQHDVWQDGTRQSRGLSYDSIRHAVLSADVLVDHVARGLTRQCPAGIRQAEPGRTASAVHCCRRMLQEDLRSLRTADATRRLSTTYGCNPTRLCHGHIQVRQMRSARPRHARCACTVVCQ